MDGRELNLFLNEREMNRLQNELDTMWAFSGPDERWIQIKGIPQPKSPIAEPKPEGVAIFWCS
jgi:hypothetical protein